MTTKTNEPTNADVGKIILVRDYECDPWFPRRLLRIDNSQLGPFYECERDDGKPGNYLWAYGKRHPNPEIQFPVVTPTQKLPVPDSSEAWQAMAIDPKTMQGRCYTCRFWIDSDACEQVKATQPGVHAFNQDCRECWARHPFERAKTMAHELCAQWQPKFDLFYGTVSQDRDE